MAHDRQPAEKVIPSAAVRFLTLQVFSLIYLQKFAIGSSSFQLGVPMLIMLGSMIPYLARRTIGFDRVNLAFYLLFIGLCFCSQVFVSSLSVPSFGEILVLYVFFVVQCDISNAEYEHVLRFFIRLLVLPSFIVIFQFSYQKLTGRADPLNMDQMVPNAFLMHGFIYHAPYYFGFAFTRPNGFFFLETSFVSAFTAAGAVVEATYFRRPRYVCLLLLATFLSLGGTGVTLLIAAAPFLLARESKRIITLVLIAAIAGLLIAYLAGVPLPLVSRIDELDTSGSSGADRILLPLRDFVSMLSDPGFVLSGTGAGTASNAGSVWPVVKLLHEYGLVEAVSFVIFYLVGISSRGNVPLKVGLSVVYHFTGGYLLNAVMVEFIAIFCFILKPALTQRAHIAGATLDLHLPGRRPPGIIRDEATSDGRIP